MSLELWNSTQRIGFLPLVSDSLRIREVINGEYFAFFDYPKVQTDSERYDDIVVGNEIRFPSDVENGQRFFIQSVDEVQRDQKVFKSVEAIHVGLTLARYFHDGFVDFSAAQAPEDMLTLLAVDTPFTFVVEGAFIPQDIFDWGEDSKLALLHRLRELYNAELSFDNYTITFTTRKGVNNGKQIRRRKNMKGIQCTTRDDSRITRLYGYGKNGLTIEGYAGHTEKYIDSIHFDSDRPFIAKKEWSDIDDQGRLLAEMQKYLASNELPKVSYEVETVRLGPIDLGDTVTVIDEVLGYNFDARLREYERYPYNPAIRPRLVIGNFRPLNTTDYIVQATVGSKKAIQYTSRNAVLKGVKYDDSLTLVDGLGMKVTDAANNERVRIGQVGPGIYGMWVASGAIQLAGGLPDSQIASASGWNGKTTLLTSGGIYTGTVQANQINAASLSAISANLGTVTAGSIYGAYIATSASYPKIEFSSSGNLLTAYYNANSYISLVPNLLDAPSFDFVVGSSTEGRISPSASGLAIAAPTHALYLTAWTDIEINTIFGTVGFSNWGKLVDRSTGQSLQTALNSVTAKFK